MPTILVEDAGDAIALFQPSGTICKRRAGRRGGPRGRNLLDGWDGRHEDVVWREPANLKLYIPGTAHAVHRRWESNRFAGWYVNLEAPWTRTTIGFDSVDHILDIEVADDLSWWRWKDEDELDWASQVGRITLEQHRAVRDEGERVVERIEQRAWPFGEDGWTRWAPDATWTAPEMPAGWDVT